MKPVSDLPQPQSQAFIDYGALTKKYNELEMTAGLQLEKVYNITLFKRALERRGLIHGEDFHAYNKNGSTYVQRLTEKRMKGF